MALNFEKDQEKDTDWMSGLKHWLISGIEALVWWFKALVIRT